MSRFLVDFSIALHRVAMYPPDHPTLVPALDTLVNRVRILFSDRPRFAIGVARDRLVIEGFVSEVAHPLLHSLAEHLHRHRLAAISFERGVCRSEVTELLAALAAVPEHGGLALGRLPATPASAWPHVVLHPFTIDGLDIIESRHETATAHSSRYTDLWIGLARAALERNADDSACLDDRPAAVARAISEHQRVEAYDQVIAGYLQQIADELREAGGAEAIELRHRVSALVRTMDEAALGRLLEMGGDGHGRHHFLQNAAVGMAADAVVALVRSAAAASDQTVSTSVVRLLSKLAVHAEGASARVRPLADAALRSQVDRLIAGWSLTDPSPGDYTDVLNRLARTTCPSDGRQSSGEPNRIEPLRVVEMCLELDEDTPALWRAVDRLGDDGDLVRLVEVLGEVCENDLRRQVWARMASAGMVRRLIARVPPDFVAIDRLLPRLHGDALSPLIDLLTSSDDRPLRRAAFDRLRRLSRQDAAQILARMGDGPWYLLRNLLALLAELEELPEDFDPSGYLAHPDSRVRREALRVSLRMPAFRDRALSAALADEDPRVLRIALAAARERCPLPGVRQVLAVVGREDLEDDVRAAAIEALAHANRGPQVLDALMAVASRSGRFLRGPVLASKSASTLAALTALASGWPHDTRAAAVIRRAAASPDIDVRRSVGAASP